MDPVRPIAMEAWDNRIDMKRGRAAHGRDALVHRKQATAEDLATSLHGGNELMLICDPGTTVIHHGQQVAAPPGTLFLHLPWEAHGVVGDGAPTRLLVINYEPDEAFELRFPALAPGARRHWRLDSAQMAAYLDLFTRLQAELDTRRTGFAESASAWIRQLLVLVARLDEPVLAAGTTRTLQPVDPDLRRLRRAIDQRRQGSTSGGLQHLVENYDSLRHRFRRTYGESPGQMLSRLRVEKAKALLITTALSMADIAVQCGYSRQHEFSRAFHREVGCTPSAYRRQGKLV